MPPSPFSAVIVALGLALGGWFIGHGFIKGRSSARYVEVKGLNVPDLASSSSKPSSSAPVLPTW
jgi:hypothetical protein